MVRQFLQSSSAPQNARNGRCETRAKAICFDDERYAQLEDKLRRAEAYFERLAKEIQDKAAITDKIGYYQFSRVNIC